MPRFTCENNCRHITDCDGWCRYDEASQRDAILARLRKYGERDMRDGFHVNPRAALGKRIDKRSRRIADDNRYGGW